MGADNVAVDRPNLLLSGHLQGAEPVVLAVPELRGGCWPKQADDIGESVKGENRRRRRIGEGGERGRKVTETFM
jgi:hypothetical protein